MIDDYNSDERGLIPIPPSAMREPGDSGVVIEYSELPIDIVASEERIRELSTPQGTTRLLVAALLGMREITSLVAEHNAISERRAVAEERQVEVEEAALRVAVDTNKLIEERNKLLLRQIRENERRDLLDFLVKVGTGTVNVLLTYSPAIIAFAGALWGHVDRALAIVLGTVGVCITVTANMLILRRRRHKRRKLASSGG